MLCETARLTVDRQTRINECGVAPVGVATRLHAVIGSEYRAVAAPSRAGSRDGDPGYRE